MIRQWKRWEMKHPSNRAEELIHYPKQNEHFTSTFCGQCWPYTVLTLQKLRKIICKSAARPTRTPKGTEKTPTSVQHCTPRRRLVNTSCERRRWLSKPTVSTFTEKRNGWTEYPSSAQQTFRKHLKLKHQSQLAKSTSSRWRLFELDDEQLRDAHEQTSSQHDTTLETSLRWKPEYERPPPPTEMSRFARLPQCTPHRFKLRSETSDALRNETNYHPHQKKTWTPCVLEIFHNKTVQPKTFLASPTNVYTWTHSVAGTWSTNPEVKHTQQHDVLMMRSMDVGKAWWNETSNICGDAQRWTTHMLTKLPRPLHTTMNNKIRIQLVRGMKPTTPNKNTMRSSQKTHSTMKKHTEAGSQRFKPECGVRMTQPIVLGETIWETASAKKKNTSSIHKQKRQEQLRKKITNRTLARTTGLPPRPHLHQRNQETTHKQSTNTNHVPLKNKMPEMVGSNLRFTKEHAPVTHHIRRNRSSEELVDNDTTWKKQQCSTTITLYKWQENRGHHDIQKIWCLYVHRNIMASWWCTQPPNNQTLTQCCLLRTPQLSPLVGWQRCMKRPPPSKVMPRLNRLCRCASRWLKLHAIERRRFAQQDKNTRPTTCPPSNIVRRIEMADLTNHGRPLWICTVESTDTLNKTWNNKKKLACSTLVHCNVMLLARSENKLWFIHQNLRHVDRRICWADIQQCVQGIYAFLLVLRAHSILNRAKMKCKWRSPKE